MLTRDLVPKIGDFGLAICQREERPVTRAGTLVYMAPEMLSCPGKFAPSDHKDRADIAYDFKVSVGACAFGHLVTDMIVASVSRDCQT